MHTTLRKFGLRNTYTTAREFFVCVQNASTVAFPNNLSAKASLANVLKISANLACHSFSQRPSLRRNRKPVTIFFILHQSINILRFLNGQPIDFNQKIAVNEIPPQPASLVIGKIFASRFSGNGPLSSPTNFRGSPCPKMPPFASSRTSQNKRLKRVLTPFLTPTRCAKIFSGGG